MPRTVLLDQAQCSCLLRSQQDLRAWSPSSHCNIFLLVDFLRGKTEKIAKPEIRSMDLLCWRRGNLTATNKQTNSSVMKDIWVLYKVLLGAMKLKAAKSFSSGLWQEKWSLWLRVPPQLVFKCQLSICCQTKWALDRALCADGVISRAEVLLSSTNSHP